MADRLDVVPIGVPDEGGVVGGVVLGPEPRLVEDLGADRRGGLEESTDRVPVAGGEGDMGLPEAVAGVLFSYPERRLSVGSRSRWRGLLVLHDPFPAEGGEDGVVEGGALFEVGALDGHVSEHGQILAAPGLPGAAGPANVMPACAS